jgi:hypothetical protein
MRDEKGTTLELCRRLLDEREAGILLVDGGDAQDGLRNRRLI